MNKPRQKVAVGKWGHLGELYRPGEKRWDS